MVLAPNKKKDGSESDQANSLIFKQPRSGRRHFLALDRYVQDQHQCHKEFQALLWSRGQCPVLDQGYNVGLPAGMIS